VSKHQGRGDRQIRSPVKSRCDGEPVRAKGAGISGRENPLASKKESVPQSDTGRRVENTKVDE
jgi:hypothetical protein